MKDRPRSKSRVLLAAYGGGHINTLIPVYKLLRQRGVDAQMLGLTLAQEKLQQHGLPYLSVRDFLKSSDQDALELGRQLVENMRPHPAVPFEETIAYMGLCYRELIEDHGKDQAAELYSALGRQCFLPRRFARRVLEVFSPSMLVTTNSPRMEHALLLEARDLKIPSCCVSDFWVVEHMENPGYSDTIMVPFDAVKQRLVAAGWQPDNVHVSGNPALDYLAQKDFVSARERLREQRGWAGKRVILLVKSVMSVLAPSEALAEAHLIERYRGDADTIIVLRPHPNDPMDYSDKASDNFVISTVEEPLLDVLAAIDSVVTVNSTVGLEANLLGKQVIQLNMVDFDQHVPFSRLGIGWEATDIPSLDRALNGPERLGLLPPCMAVGKATDYVVDHIIYGRSEENYPEPKSSR